MTSALCPGFSGSGAIVPSEAIGNEGQSAVKFLSRNLCVSRIQIPITGALKSSSESLKSISRSVTLSGTTTGPLGYWPMVQCGWQFQYWFALQLVGALHEGDFKF